MNYIQAGVTNKMVKMNTYNRTLNVFETINPKNMMMTFIITEYLINNVSPDYLFIFIPCENINESVTYMNDDD
jgi:hypothetical protein